MIYDLKPFLEDTYESIKKKGKINLEEFNLKFPSKPTISKDCKNFLSNCLKINQNERLNLSQAIKHKYFEFSIKNIALYLNN